MTQYRNFLSDEAATLAAGRAIGAALAAGLVIFLHGDLGAGKTTLTRGMLAGLGYQGRVKSPTYTLLEPYSFSRLDFYHFDLYRFRDEQEWHDAGFRDYFNRRSICVVEWPEKALALLPPPDLDITLELSPVGALYIESKAPSANELNDVQRNDLQQHDRQRSVAVGRGLLIESGSEQGTLCLDRIRSGRA